MLTDGAMTSDCLHEKASGDNSTCRSLTCIGASLTKRVLEASPVSIGLGKILKPCTVVISGVIGFFPWLESLETSLASSDRKECDDLEALRSDSEELSSSTVIILDDSFELCGLMERLK